MIVSAQEVVHPDHLLPARFDAPLKLLGRPGNLPLEPAALDARHHAPDRLDLREERLRFPLEVVGQRLDVVRPAERVDDVLHAGLVGDDLLCAEREADRILGRQGERFV